MSFVEDIDTDVVVGLLIIIGIVVVIVVGGMAAMRSIEKEPLRKSCEDNPRLWQQENCNNKKECVELCAERLLRKE